MRVLHVFTVPLSLRFLRGQVQFMGQQGIDVHAACATGPRGPAFEAETGVPVHEIPIERRMNPQQDLTAIGATARLIRRLRPDIVHAHTPKGGLIGMLAATVARAPGRIYHMRGLPYLTAEGPMRRILWGTESTSCGLAHRVIAVSPSLAAAAKDAGFVGHSKIRVLSKGSSNGVDTERFDPRRADGSALRESLGLGPDQPLVTFVGRIVGDKGIAELQTAWTRVSAEHPDARLLLVGPKEERDAIPADLWRAIEDDPSVLHVPFTEEMPAVYAASQLVVLPTYREGFPNVPLEAASMERPVITTDAVGAIDSVVDGQTGRVVPVRRSAELAEAIGGYLADPELGRRHGQVGRERVLAHFQPITIWRELLREYRELAAK